MERVNGTDQFYSRMINGTAVELFVDSNGRPTTARPHVHVVHHGSGRVDVVATNASGGHPWRTQLSNPSGNDVNRAIQDAWQHM